MQQLAPITASSLAEAKLEHTQKRLSFLWEAAHATGIAQMAPAVAAGLLRSLRCLAFQEDIALAASHTQTNFCTQCCAVRVPGINTTARVERSAAKRKAERNKRRRKDNRKAKRPAEANQQEATANSANLTGSATDPSDSDHSLVTPQKKRKRASLSQTDSAAATSSARSTSAAASGFVSPFAGRAALPVSASLAPSLSSAASISAASGVSPHCLVLHCLRCGHRERIAGQSHKQKQLLQAAPDDLESLAAQTEQGQSQIASEAAARDQLAKRQKTLQSLQVQQQQPSMITQPKLRTAMPTLEELALTQQRLQQARAANAAGSFFGEQVRDAAAPAQQRPAATAAALAPSPPAPSAAAPFSFSRSGAAAASSSGKKPSLSSLLAQATSAAAAPSSVFSSASMFTASPASSSMQGIRIAGGIASSAAHTAAGSGSSKGYTFTKSSGAAGAQKKR